MIAQHDGVHERLLTAVEGLATAPGSIQERLANAATTLIPLRQENFHDPEARRTFAAIVDDLQASGSFAETAPDMGAEEASAIAARIVALAVWAIRTAR
jgi:hypothetical protein